MEENKTNIETEVSENVKAINQNNIPNGRKKKSKLGLVLIFMLLIALGFNLWYFVFNKKDEKGNEPTTVNKNISWEDKEISSNSEKTIKVYKSKDDSKLLGFFMNGELKGTYKIIDDNYFVAQAGQYFGGYYGNTLSIQAHSDKCIKTSANGNGCLQYESAKSYLYNVELGKMIAESDNMGIAVITVNNSNRINGGYLFTVKNKNNKYGIVNEKGDNIVDFEYDYIGYKISINNEELTGLTKADLINDKYYISAKINDKNTLISISENKHMNTYNGMIYNYIGGNYYLYEDDKSVNIYDMSTDKLLLEENISSIINNNYLAGYSSCVTTNSAKLENNSLKISVLTDKSDTECSGKYGEYEYDIITKKLIQKADRVF